MSASTAEPVNFAPYFTGREVRPVEDATLMDRAYQLRHQVYCLECHYLDAADYPDGRERDDCDIHSSHFVSLNLQDEIAGYVRLVRPDAIQTFPFQTHCVQLLDGVSLPPADQSAEISRLMVSSRYRRRHGDKLAGVNVDEDHLSDHERRISSPQILLCMYRQMYQYSLKHDIRYWYAAMERYLAKALKGMNFGFQQIGPYTDYYGPVAPFLGDLRQLEDGLSQSAPALLEWMRSEA
jgi:N-acyl amino acid synthase of PEP-CTERM/exosortase system